MWNRYIKSLKLLPIVTICLTLVLAISCGGAAQPEPDSAGQEVAQEVPTDLEGSVPTATPSPATGGGGIVESSVVRFVEAQGETTQEGNWFCAGNRPFHTENFRALGELLIDVDPVTAQLEPWMAESWEPSADSKSWTVKIREGIPFHFDYGEYTAEDAAWLAEEMRQDDCLASTTSFWKELDRVEIVDDHTLTFHMKNTTFLLPEYISSSSVGAEFFGFSKDQYESVGRENIDNEKVAGTNYWQVLERKLGESMVYERVPYEHWRAMPPFQEYETRWIGEESTRLAGLLAGEIHAIALSRDLQEQAIDEGMKIIPAQQAFTQLSVFFGGMYFIPGDPDFDPTTPWTDIRVRQAMNKALNRDELNEFILRGQGEIEYVTGVCHEVLQPECYNPEWAERWDEMYGYDPAKAEQLLIEAGYGPDNPFDLTLINYRTRGEPEAPLIIEALSQYWGPLGINVTIQDLDPGAATKLWREKQMQHSMWANVFSFRPVAYRVRSNASMNTNSHYFDHPFNDQKFEEMLQVTTLEEETAIGREVANFWYDQFYTVPLFWFKFNMTVNPEVIEDWVFLNRGHYQHLITPAK